MDDMAFTRALTSLVSRQIGAEVRQSLRDSLPELHFVHGLTGHLTYRAKLEHPEQFRPETGTKLLDESLFYYRSMSVPQRSQKPQR
jgi:hypothetical protein